MGYILPGLRHLSYNSLVSSVKTSEHNQQVIQQLEMWLFTVGNYRKPIGKYALSSEAFFRCDDCGV